MKEVLRWRKEGNRGELEQSLGQGQHLLQPLLVLPVPCHMWGCSEPKGPSSALRPPMEPAQAEAG